MVQIDATILHNFMSHQKFEFLQIPEKCVLTNVKETTICSLPGFIKGISVVCIVWLEPLIRKKHFALSLWPLMYFKKLLLLTEVFFLKQSITSN